MYNMRLKYELYRTEQDYILQKMMDTWTWYGKSKTLP